MLPCWCRVDMKIITESISSSMYRLEREVYVRRIVYTKMFVRGGGSLLNDFLHCLQRRVIF